MTPPESPASLLERAATRLEREGGGVTRPISTWFRETAEVLRCCTKPRTFQEQKAVECATLILGTPVPGEDE